jgi:hypothetical protein
MAYQKVFNAFVNNFTSIAEKQYLKGIQKYNTELFTFNGRNAAKDLYEELVDAFNYATQLEMERDELCKIIHRGMVVDELPQAIQEYIERYGKD